MKDIDSFLEQLYEEAMSKASGQPQPSILLDKKPAQYINLIVDNSESSKGVLAVLMTSLVYKILHPEQDIRKHQASIEGGYSGRTFDTTYITPFLQAHSFPAMRESGWLTRSLEQKVPYDLNYTGAIRPLKLKEAFLNIIDVIETKSTSREASELFDYLLQSLIIQRDTKQISLAIPKNLSIEFTVDLLNNHFHSAYTTAGAARLPVLAIYAIYKCLFAEGQKRYKGKTLLPLESHTSADMQSGRLGDIDLVDDKCVTFEAVEVKFDIPVTHQVVEAAKRKILSSGVKRYYILSTKHILDKEKAKIEEDIKQIKNVHGCQLIVNGVLPTIKYYLRLLETPSTFIEYYVALLDNDDSIKFEHKQAWNTLISKI